jgi:D-alanine-D-alanine ligase
MPSPSPDSEAIHVGVVFGGASGEHDVSILSARTVVSGLRQGKNADRYRLSCFYVDRRGTWWPPEVAEAVLNEGSPPASEIQPHPFPANR